MRFTAQVHLKYEVTSGDFKDDPELEGCSASDKNELLAIAEKVELGDLEEASKLAHGLDTILRECIDDNDWNYIDGLPHIRKDVVKFIRKMDLTTEV